MITSRPMQRCTITKSRLLLVLFSLLLVFPVSSYGDDLDSALDQLATYRFGDNREILSAVEDIVSSSDANSTERSHIEKGFSKLLTSDATYECKDFICRQLWVIGSKESVPALAVLLADSTTCDIARYALQDNPSEEAGKALRNAMKKATGVMLTGIINSIGHRGDTGAVKQLSSCVFDINQYSSDISMSAIAALGRIPSDDAGKVLAKARNGACPVRSQAASEALLIWADTFLAGNGK